MLQVQLITLEDINKYRPVSLHIDPARINPYILEAQYSDLRPVLNEVFYLDFLKKVNDPTAPEYPAYQELLNGKEYEHDGHLVEYPGLKPMIAYYAYARFITKNPIHATRFGMMQKTVEQSTPVDYGLIKTNVNEARSLAVIYQNNLTLFLDRNIDTYPLWREGRDKKVIRRKGVGFFKA